MRTLTAAMKAHLASGSTTLAKCWKTTRSDGTVLRGTTHVDTIEYPQGSGEFYLSSVGYTASDVVSSTDLSVDNLEIEGFLASPEITLDDIRSGKWDYAAIEFFAVNYRDLSPTMGSIPIRSGTMGEVNSSLARFTAEVRGLMQAYTTRILQLTSPTCRAEFGDARCKLNKADFTVSSWVQGTVSSDNRVLDVSLAYPVDWFTNGEVTWVTGQNAGISMEVKSWNGSQLVLQEAMPFPIVSDATAGFGNGDRFTVVVGCMHEFMRDCVRKFGNGVNFRGEPPEMFPGAAIYGGPGTSTSGLPPVTSVPPAPAPTPAPAPSSFYAPPPASPPGAAPFFPFGSRLDGAYPNGVMPTQTTATMDAAVAAMYDAWKAARLKAAPAFVATDGIYAGQNITGAYYVDSNTIRIADGPPVVYAGTVSEGMGYGMLFAVLMAGHDPNAQDVFDGLFKLVRARPAAAMLPAYYGGSTLPQNYLMTWRLGQDMSDQGGGFNAQDGDMDMALALMMAHRQWGSAGAIDYWTEAQNTIGALKVSGFDAATGIMYVPLLGDPAAAFSHDVSRTSDYMAGHFRSFKASTNDTFWDTGRANSLTLVTGIINTFSPTAKLPPGWIWKPLTPSAQPSPGIKIESGIEGIYDANAVRDPLRWGVDFLWSGDAGWGTLASQCVATIKATASGDPAQTTWAYDLDGTPYEPGLYYEPPTVACTMVGGMTNAAHQAWVDACWTKITGTAYNTNYYTAELVLLGMLIASGNWWRP